jgi:hypothetical protein
MKRADVPSMSDLTGSIGATWLTDARLGGLAAIIGAGLMIVGAILLVTSGADLNTALAQDSIGVYLVDAAENKTILSANLSFWMFGVVVLAASGILFARISIDRPTIAALGAGAYILGAALALVAFSVWLALVREIAPAHVAGTDLTVIGAALGEIVSVMDWVATVLVLGIGQGLIAIAGRGRWVPNWLFIWGIVVLAAGALAIVGLILDMRTSVPPVGVVAGLGWPIAAGIVALRYEDRNQMAGNAR